MDENLFSLPDMNRISSKKDFVAALRVVWAHVVQVY